MLRAFLESWGCTTSSRRVLTLPAPAIAFAACLLMVMLAGCGGESRSTTTTASTSSDSDDGRYSGGYETDTSADAPYDDGATTQEETEVVDDSPAPGPADPGERPEDVTQWKPEHYTTAKIEQDPKLGEAVRYLDQAKFRASPGGATVLPTGGRVRVA